MDETMALDGVLERARVVRAAPVRAAGPGGEIRVDLGDPAESVRFRTAMAVDSLPGFHCMCIGDVRLELLGGDGGRLTEVVLHHGRTLRWERWESDAVLTDGRLLLDWLAEHGMPGPLEQFEAALRRNEEADELRRAWVAVMPAALEEFTDRILGLSPFDGGAEAALLADLEDRLRHHVPDPVERTLALLAWFGSGSGRCSGYPSYEGVPGELLGALPITDLLSALADPRAGDRHDAGAVRHLVGWKTRPDQKQDVAALPDSLRARLLAHARRSGDADKQSRAEGWLAPARG
ncbi:hypothetical protein [Kitasatospora cinereorecta]|uniref:Uncharacterized protein n=1 Tax=Kitasatospora cinereorecta TaxID=285560 RepID=A0ABW0V6P8_9ACTN